MKIIKNIRRNSIKAIPPTLLLLVLLVMLISTVKTFKKSSGSWEYFIVEFNTRPWQESYEQKVDPLIPLNTAKHLKPGLQEHDSSGKVALEIIESQVFERQNGFAKATAVVKMYGYQNKTTHDFIYKGQPIKLNTALEFNFPQLTVPGQIVESVPAYSTIEKSYLNGNTLVNLTLRVYSTPYWESNQITRGDYVVNLINNDRIATIQRVTKNISSRYVFIKPTQQYTNRFLEEDSEISDVDVEITAQINIRDGIRYFEYSQPIKIGSTIQFSTNKIGNITGEITSINEDHSTQP